jgi:hypothetical protein
MTTPINETETGAFAARQPRATSFMDWFHVNRVWVATAGAAVVIAGIVAWYVPHDRLIKSGVADKMLLDAKQSIQSGNVQLAESDLKKVADRYPKLPSGVEAGMLVGQLRLDRGDVAGAVTYLSLRPRLAACWPMRSPSRTSLPTRQPSTSAPPVRRRCRMRRRC